MSNGAGMVDELVSVAQGPEGARGRKVAVLEGGRKGDGWVVGSWVVLPGGFDVYEVVSL